MKARQLRKITLFRPVFLIRDFVWKKLGLFDVKARMKMKFFLKRLVREDEALKREVLQKIENIPDNIIQNIENNANCVVSITSYGQRLTDSLPFTLYSILTQTKLPKKIAVFLDYVDGKIPKLPPVLETLKRKGVDFFFIEEPIRSMKKLLPALKMFPNDVIITFDDDMYYDKNTINNIVDEYFASDGKTVMGYNGLIETKCDGQFAPYNTWIRTKPTVDSAYSLLGVSGILYPPHIFDDEIHNADVFMKLCPTGDDIWFWAMEKRQSIRTKLLPKTVVHRSVNRSVEYGAHENTLMYINVTGNKNNEQLFNVVNYYEIK